MDERHESTWQDIRRITPNYLNTNLDTLSTKHPHIHEALQTSLHHLHIELHRTEHTPTQAAELIEDRSMVFYDTLDLQKEFRRVQRFSQQLTPAPQTQLYFILGFDLGFTLTQLIRFISQSTRSAFVVIEPDIRMAACTFATQDMTHFLQSNRIDFVVGKDYLSQLDTVFEQRNYFALPEIKVVASTTAHLPRYADEWTRLKDTTSHLQKKYQHHFQTELEETRQFYQNKPCHPIQTMLSLVQTGGLAVRFIQQRFLTECQKQGVEIMNYQPGFANEIGILRTIHRYKPDCLLFINRSPGEYVSTDVLNTIHIPRMVWCVDDPNSFIKESFHRNDIVFTWDDSYAEDMKRKGAYNVDHFPYVADLDQVNANVREDFLSPVSYVGQVKAFHPQELGLDDPTAALVKHVAREKSKNPLEPYQNLILENQDSFGLRILNEGTDDVPRYVRYSIYLVANALRRIRILETAMPFGLKIYGGTDWLEVLGDHPLKDCYCGLADPQTDVPDIFLSSKINLNIHSLQALTSLNQRDFNCPLVGGFLLTDWVEKADAFFIPGKELMFYHDTEDLKGKIAYFLNHEEERKDIIERGKRRVMKDHTYASRVPKVIDTLNQRIQEQMYSDA